MNNKKSLSLRGYLHFSAEKGEAGCSITTIVRIPNSSPYRSTTGAEITALIFRLPSAETDLTVSVRTACVCFVIYPLTCYYPSPELLSRCLTTRPLTYTVLKGLPIDRLVYLRINRHFFASSMLDVGIILVLGGGS